MRFLKALGVIALLVIIQLILCKLAVFVGDYRTEVTHRGELQPEQIRTFQEEFRRNFSPGVIENDSPMDLPCLPRCTPLANPASAIVKR
jgi:hypothetical protein